MALRWLVILALTFAPACWRVDPSGCFGPAAAPLSPEGCCCQGVDACPCLGHAPEQSPIPPTPAKPTNPGDDAWRAAPTTDGGWWLATAPRAFGDERCRATGATEHTLRRLARLCVWRT